MSKGSAIKWRMVWINTWILGAIYFVLFIGEERIYGTHNVNWIFGSFFIIYALVYYFRVRVYQILLVFLTLGLGFYHSVLVLDFHMFFSMKTLAVHIVIFFFAMIFGMPVIARAYKMEVYSRKLFKLASEQVTAISAGFTSRPFSAGTHNFKKEEILGFVRYLKGKEIAGYRIVDDMVLIGISMGISPVADPEFDRISTVSFVYNGNLFVHISEHDYKMYKERLSFDQLCASLASLFKEFLEYYRNGKEDRIMIELKNV
jgi:hypothetical protein